MGYQKPKNINEMIMLNKYANYTEPSSDLWNIYQQEIEYDYNTLMYYDDDEILKLYYQIKRDGIYYVSNSEATAIVCAAFVRDLVGVEPQ